MTALGADTGPHVFVDDVSAPVLFDWAWFWAFPPAAKVRAEEKVNFALAKMSAENTSSTTSLILDRFADIVRPRV